MAAALGGQHNRHHRRVNSVAGEQRAERDTCCQAYAPEQHEDHDPPEHTFNVLRYAMLVMALLMAHSGDMENHLDPRLSTGVRIGDLLALGATQLADHRRPDGSGWITLADPEGNEFCILSRDPARSGSTT
jgi:hypothetical protein